MEAFESRRSTIVLHTDIIQQLRGVSLVSNIQIKNPAVFREVFESRRSIIVLHTVEGVLDISQKLCELFSVSHS